MEHEEYVKLREMLVEDLKGEFQTLDACKKTVTKEDDKIDDLKTEFTKSNTKLNIVIGMLSAIGVPLISVCIKMLFHV